jgi:FkbM family methyltransferase
MLKRKLLKLVSKILAPMGFALTRGSYFTQDAALKRCKQRGLEVATVIDVGASNGQWANLCMEHYPNAKYLLVEAQVEHEEGLMKFKNKHSNVEYIICAAGNHDGEIYFNNEKLLGGIASEKPFEKNSIRVPMFKIDTLIQKFNLQPPFLIKLDTHGFEVPIIEGSSEALKKTNLFIVEVYNYRLSEKALKYYEMCTYMEKRSFSTVEIVDFLSRKHDNSLWQMDMFFIQSNSKEFSYNNYE